jgi:hypothetical protein
MPSPARSPPTTARPVSSALTRAPASTTSPPLYPSRPLTPRLPEPSHRRLRHHRHHGKLVGVVVPPPFPPPRAPIKGPPELYLLHTSHDHLPLAFPSLIELAPPRPPFAPVSSVLSSLVAFDRIALVLEVRHPVTILAHGLSTPIAPDGLANDLTAASARNPPWTGHPGASTGQIDPTPVIPYPQPCLATAPPP